MSTEKYVARVSGMRAANAPGVDPVAYLGAMRCRLLFLVPLLAACKDCRGNPVPLTAEKSAMILVLDGVRSEEYSSDERVSDLTGMTGEAYASETWATLGPDMNPGVTITAPGHAEMVTGRLDPYANFAVSNGPGLYRPEYPTIFEELRGQLGLDGDQAVFIGNTELLQGEVQSIQPGSAEAAGEYTLLYDPDVSNAPINDDTPMVGAIESAVSGHRPRLLVANFHDVDRAGHYGAGDAYINDVKKIDRLLPELWQWLGENDPAYRDNLLVFITADHGRHRHDGDDGWHNHGDTCSGCREVPLMVLGAEAPGGEELAGNWTLLDLAPTLAAHVGFDAPWAQGLPIDEVVSGGNTREGDVGLSADGTAWVRYRADDLARDEVVIDDQVVSTEGAMFAQGVRAGTAGATRWACWRELETIAELYWPWVGRCQVDAGSGWLDVGFPEEMVGPNWEPVLVEHEGATWAVFNNNPDGIGELGSEHQVGMRVRALEADGTWGAGYASEQYWPTNPAAVSSSGGLLLAFGTNLQGDDSRYTRRVRVLQFGVEHEAFGGAVDIDLAGLLDGARVERPALRADGDVVQLAVVGTTETENVVALLESEDGGATWSTGEVVSADPVLPHLSPQWDGADLVWAARSPSGNAELCRRAPGADATCEELDSERIDSFSATAGTAVIDTGVAAWERVAP